MDDDKLTEWNEQIQSAERAQRAGKYDYAEASWMLAVEEAESFGTRDKRLAYSLEKLTECLWFQGRLEEALHYGYRALEVYEVALGPTHNDVGSMAYNVAMIYHVLNYFDHAEKHYKRALAIKTGLMGAKHPEVIKILGSFADLLVKLGREDEARQLRATEKVVTAANWSQTNSGRDVGGQVLGHQLGGVSGNYPSIQGSVSGNYPPVSASGNYPAMHPGSPTASGSFPSMKPGTQSASGSYPPVQAGSPTASGNYPIMPGTASGNYPVQQQGSTSGSFPPVNTGGSAGSKPSHSSLIKQIRRASADNPYQADAPRPADLPGSAQPVAPPQEEPKQSHKKVEEHFENSMRLALPNSGSYGKSFDEMKAIAEKAFQEGNLTIAEGALREGLSAARAGDPANPNYCFVLETLGEVYLRQQNFQRAEDCLKTAYDIKKRVLGNEHAAVAGTASNLARLYYMIYKFEESESLSIECIRIQEKLSGPNSLDTATALHNLATVYHVQKKYAQAEPFYERAMKIKQLQLGGDHPETVRILKAYAQLLRSTHRDEQAEMLDQCVTGMISGKWRAVQVKDVPESGWWKEVLATENEET